ncbi:MAG: carboxymuconolactone decarboxylase family protein, partial [Nitrososphaerales archaeon]
VLHRIERLIVECKVKGFGDRILKDETRKYLIEEMSRVHEVFQVLDRYDPKLTDALASLRRVAIPGRDDTGSTLEAKYKELIMVAVETATGRGEKGKSHARKAIRAGATPKQVQEALALCIYLVGMSSWVDGGMECVLAAEEEQEKVNKGEKFSWSAEVSGHKKE